MKNYINNDIGMMSVFGHGYRNRSGVVVLDNNPYGTLTVADVHRYITSDAAKGVTDFIRTIDDDKKRGDMKKELLYYITPHGVFSYRKAKDQVSSSELGILDFDHMGTKDDIDHLRRQLIDDPRLDLALFFRSPTGDGAKALVNVGRHDGRSLKEVYADLFRHVAFEYGVMADESGTDAARACFLCHDPECYINPKYLP